MENLEIISTQMTVQAKKTINGNTVNFSWNYKEGELPPAVNFNVQRGVVGGEQPFTGNNIISGAFYANTDKFDVNNNNFVEGDLVIYAEILTTCKGIITELQ